MENKINSLVINQKDSVAVALEDLKDGNIGKYKIGEEIKETRIIQEIPIYHKFAIINVKEGDLIYKYGEIIGTAIQDIKKGQHVHSHNLVSIRESIK